MYQVKIFEENNKGLDDLEQRINSFFEKNQYKKIYSTSMCVEVVYDIPYKSILIIYEDFGV